MSIHDLTTLAALKSWLGLPANNTTNDAQLAAAITAASRWIYATLGRSTLLPAAYVETFSAERPRVFLRHWPVISVTSVTLDGRVIPAAPYPYASPSTGYYLQPADVAPPGAPQALEISDGLTLRRSGRFVVNYTAGYSISNESQTSPATAPYQLSPNCPFGPWAKDLGVVNVATGATLAAATSAPAKGQYAILNGLYTFAAADAGASLSLSYGYIPQDLAQAALELAAERFRSSDRIGLRSKSAGGQETIAYDLSAMSSAVEAMIAAYRKVMI